MTMTVLQFRQAWPEFTSTTQYPDAQVAFWLAWAYMFINAPRWGQALDLGAGLFTAHNLSIEAVAQAEGANGAPPGRASGVVSAKTVEGLTITYDVAAAVNEQDQHWATTIYGTRFVKLARQFGSGPVQLGIGVAPIGQQFGATGYPMGAPWPGPLFENWTD